MEKTEHLADPSELKSLADYLLDNQDAISARWQDMVQARGKEQPSALASVSHRTFFENIPSFLQHVCRSLRSGATTTEQPGEQHRGRLWDRGLDLRVVVSGWTLLHRVLADQISRSRESITISPGSLAEAHRRLPLSIHDGISRSVDTYYRFRHQELERQLQDLEAVVRQQSTQKGQREQNLHQVSHDLKGSMTALRMNLNLLEKTDLGNHARGLVEKLSRAADSLTQLLDNLLEHSRLQAGREELQVSEFDAAGLLGSLCESMQSMAGARGLELRSGGDTPLRVRGDRLKIRRIAQNLLQNALKYTHQGYVEVTWRTESPDRWTFEVRDTGPGLDPARVAFLTGTTAEEGEPPAPAEEHLRSEGGVGLLIVRQLCTILDGAVDIESEADTGTTIRITFPADYPES